MNGKDKCKILKEIRRQIAENNDIEWVVSECRHKGDCKGTCPKCESEVRKLERELENRRRLGQTVLIAGISAACIAGLAGCKGVTHGADLAGAIDTTPVIEQLDGEVADYTEDYSEDQQETFTDKTEFGETEPIEEIELAGDVYIGDE